MHNITMIQARGLNGTLELNDHFLRIMNGEALLPPCHPGLVKESVDIPLHFISSARFVPTSNSLIGCMVVQTNSFLAATDEYWVSFLQTQEAVFRALYTRLKVIQQG